MAWSCPPALLMARVMSTSSSALVLFSGGQDSTTCLASALKRYRHVETIGFDYGQRHRVELDAREDVLAAIRQNFPQWAERLGEDHLIDLGVLGQISETSLTRETEITEDEDGLPSTFVPGRNLVFLTLAAALAWRRGISVIIGGMCETDYSGYPDCRRDTIDAQQKALSRVGQEMEPLIRQVYQQRQCGLLLNRDALLLANPQMDIAPALVTALNGKNTQFAFDRERLDQQAAGAQTR